jgi:putative SOS response-associated peptidase YedK
MCGRFSLITADKETLRQRFKANKVKAEVSRRYNIAPFSTIPVILNTSPETILEARWGFLPRWATAAGICAKAMINARTETIAVKPFFKQAFRSQRCLIPADGFYEWQGVGRMKRPFRVTLKSEGLFAFAGIWDQWSDGQTELITCAIITTDANELMRPIHARMPVILTEESEQVWLETKELRDAADLLRPYDPAEMIAYEIGTAINVPANDYPGIIRSVEEKKG